MSVESVMPSNHLILCRPLLLLPSIFPSIRVFSNVSTLRIRWPKYRSFTFNISPSNEHPGLISFRMDWLDLLAVQGQLYFNFKRRQRPGNGQAPAGAGSGGWLDSAGLSRENGVGEALQVEKYSLWKARACERLVHQGKRSETMEKAVQG